jgi:hypothetical protein
MIPVDEGRAWLVATGRRTFLKTEIQHAAVAASAAATPGAPPPAGAGTDVSIPINTTPGVEGALDRLRTLEIRAFGQFVQAVQNKDTMQQRVMLRIHAEQVRRMLEAESELDRREMLRREVWSEAENAVSRWADGVRQMLVSMPRQLALLVNPSDPNKAELALTEFLNASLFPLLKRSLSGQ